MGVVDTLIGWAGGILTALVGLWVYRHTVKRDAFQDHCSSYKERIAMREKEFEQAPKGPDKAEKRRKLSDLRQEYDQFLEAWQQKQELAKLVPPRAAITTDRPRLSPAMIEEVRALLVGSERLPPVLLTKYDYITRGAAYSNVGEHQRAVDALGRALALGLEPELQRATLLLRAVALLELRRYDEALDDCDVALADVPDPDGLEIRGVVRTKLELYEDALRDFDQALELSPRNQEARYNRACTHSLMGDFQKALWDLEAAIRGNEKYREMARTDNDFEKLRNDPEYGPRFRELVGD